MKRFLWFISLLCCTAMAVAQVPTTHAGKGSPGGGGGGGYTGPGDVTGWTTGVIAWWGLRGFNAAFSGNVANICDLSTGATCANATWSSAGGGTLTLPSIGGNPCDNATHQCEVATLYDQSGALSCGTGSAVTCDLVGTHGSSRPLLVVNCLGSRPCFNGTTGNMRIANPLLNTQAEPFTFTVVANRTTFSSAISAIAAGNNGALEAAFASSANGIEMYAGSSAPILTGPADGTTHTLNFMFQSGTTIAKMQYDNVAFTAVTLSTTAVQLTGSQNLDFPSVANGALTGNLFEGGWWAGDKSANFSNIHSNQCAWWGTTC